MASTDYVPTPIAPTTSSFPNRPFVRGEVHIPKYISEGSKSLQPEESSLPTVGEMKRLRSTRNERTLFNETLSPETEHYHSFSAEEVLEDPDRMRQYERNLHQQHPIRRGLSPIQSVASYQTTEPNRNSMLRRSVDSFASTKKRQQQLKGEVSISSFTSASPDPKKTRPQGINLENSTSRKARESRVLDGPIGVQPGSPPSASFEAVGRLAVRNKQQEQADIDHGSGRGRNAKLLTADQLREGSRTSDLHLPSERNLVSDRPQDTQAKPQAAIRNTPPPSLREFMAARRAREAHKTQEEGVLFRGKKSTSPGFKKLRNIAGIRTDLRWQQEENSDTKPRNALDPNHDEDDAESVLALDAREYEKEELKKPDLLHARGWYKEAADIQEAIKLRKAEEELRRRDLEEQNAASSSELDLTPSQTQQAYYDQGYPQKPLVDSLGNSIQQQPQSTEYLNDQYVKSASVVDSTYEALKTASPDRNYNKLNHEKVHVGDEKHLSQSEADAIARARLQLILDDISNRAAKQRAKDGGLRQESSVANLEKPLIEQNRHERYRVKPRADDMQYKNESSVVHNQSHRFKEEQLLREEEKLREMELKVQREINEKRQELLAREGPLRELEARMEKDKAAEQANLNPGSKQDTVPPG